MVIMSFAFYTSEAIGFLSLACTVEKLTSRLVTQQLFPTSSNFIQLSSSLTKLRQRPSLKNEDIPSPTE